MYHLIYITYFRLFVLFWFPPLMYILLWERARYFDKYKLLTSSSTTDWNSCGNNWLKTWGPSSGNTLNTSSNNWKCTNVLFNKDDIEIVIQHCPIDTYVPPTKPWIFFTVLVCILFQLTSLSCNIFWYWLPPPPSTKQLIFSIHPPLLQPTSICWKNIDGQLWTPLFYFLYLRLGKLTWYFSHFI